MRRLSLEVVEQGGDSGGDEEEFYLSRVSLEKLPRPRRSFHRSSSSLSSALSFVSSRRSFSYDKLAQVPIHLTVVKLDGSSFEIEVTRMATIADLKEAVESVFSHLPPGKISWRHVWGHFCLSYDGSKLLNDNDSITDYGIKDGDKLHFVRHVSIAYNIIKKRSRKWLEAPKPCTISENLEEERQLVEEECGDLENLRCQQHKHEVQVNSTHHETVLSRIFRGWFLYSRLPSMENSRLEGEASPARWAGGFVCCFRSLFHFCDNRRPSISSRVSEVEI